MAGNVKLMTSAGGGVVLDTTTTTATDVTVKVPVTGVNNGTLVCSDSSGNVGIGTSSPQFKLDILTGSGGAYAAQFRNATSTQGLRIVTGMDSVGPGLTDDAGNRLIQFDQSAKAQYFWTNGAERMRIDSSGRLLVGTSSISDNGRVYSNNGGNNWCYIGEAVSQGGAYYFASWRLSGGSAIGSISSTNGTSTNYNTSSDYRLKENIQPMQNALAVIQQLNPVTYTWKADGSDGQGFIAHELQAIVPDCVTGEKDAVDADGKPVYQGIDTSFLVATLTKAIQELSAKNDALEARIAALEAK